MFFVKDIFKTTKNILIALIFLAILGYLSSQFLTFRMPWNMEVALTALFFYGLGYIAKRENILNNLTTNNKLYSISIFIISLSFAVILSLKSIPVYDLNRLGSNVIFTYISALFGILAIISLAKLINKNKFLEFLGKNTYIILAFHLSALYFMQGIFKRVGFNFESMMHSDIWGIIYLISSIILLLHIIYFINKFVPFILNK